MKLLKAFLFSILITTSACAADLPILPDIKLTPGRVFVDVGAKEICKKGYTATVRNVSDSTRKKVFELYGIDPKADRFEVDHLISLELGGSNDIMNLWPQSYTTLPWNAYAKDRLENRLRKLVCDGKMNLRQAQIEISNDWIAAYKKYIGDKQ